MARLTEAEERWVGRVWGSTPGRDRLAAEKRNLERLIADREQAAYRRALEDAADVAENNAKWGMTSEAKYFGKVYAKLFRDRAAGVGTKDGDDDE